MASKRVLVRYLGPDEVRVFRIMEGAEAGERHDFVKGGDAIPVPEYCVPRLLEQNQRGFKKDEMELAKAYCQHIFEVVAQSAQKGKAGEI